MQAPSLQNPADIITSQPIIDQLLGDWSEYDQVTDLSFVFHKCSRFNGASVNVCLDTGIVEVLNDEGTAVTDIFFIKCELVPVTLTPAPQNETP